MAISTTKVSCLLILLISVASLVSVSAAVDGATTVENAKERVDLAADEAKLKAAEAAQDAKETTESWAEWAKEKLA